MRMIVVLVWGVVVLLAGGSSTATADESAAALFQQKCAVCHTIGEGRRVGPDLRSVADRRPPEWLVRWVTRPDQMLAEKDPVAVELLAQFNQVPMPNLGVTESEAKALLDYIRLESAAKPLTAAPRIPAPAYPLPSLGVVQRIALVLFLALSAAIAVVFGWVALSTRVPQALDIKKAYRLRKEFLFIAAGGLLLAFAVSVTKTPYTEARAQSDRIVYVAARQFEFIFSFEPIVSVADLATVPIVKQLDLPVDVAVEFRVTSLDVNHNFALYGPQRRLLAQTQAMPGYVNRLRVRLQKPGRYEVLCLEYCGAGHHLMQTELDVR